MTPTRLDEIMHTKNSNLILAAFLRDPRYPLIHVEFKSPGNLKLLREAVEFIGFDYKELNLTLCYPTDLEGFFESLPDKPGVIVLSEYDCANSYIQSLLNYTALYHEYRIMLTSNTCKTVPVSDKWKFVLMARPGYWFDSTIYSRSFHFSF
jgi:hypothetical protein